MAKKKAAPKTAKKTGARRRTNNPAVADRQTKRAKSGTGRKTKAEKRRVSDKNSCAGDLPPVQLPPPDSDIQ
jgi:hypothetical protein